MPRIGLRPVVNLPPLPGQVPDEATHPAKRLRCTEAAPSWGQHDHHRRQPPGTATNSTKGQTESSEAPEPVGPSASTAMATMVPRPARPPGPTDMSTGSPLPWQGPPGTWQPFTPSAGSCSNPFASGGSQAEQHVAGARIQSHAEDFRQAGHRQLLGPPATAAGTVPASAAAVPAPAPVASSSALRLPPIRAAHKRPVANASRPPSPLVRGTAAQTGAQHVSAPAGGLLRSDNFDRDMALKTSQDVLRDKQRFMTSLRSSGKQAESEGQRKPHTARGDRADSLLESPSQVVGEQESDGRAMSIIANGTGTFVRWLTGSFRSSGRESTLLGTAPAVVASKMEPSTAGPQVRSKHLCCDAMGHAAKHVASSVLQRCCVSLYAACHDCRIVVVQTQADHNENKAPNSAKLPDLLGPYDPTLYNSSWQGLQRQLLHQKQPDLSCFMPSSSHGVSGGRCLQQIAVGSPVISLCSSRNLEMVALCSGASS
jgi:hypothetical protein